MKAGRRVVVTTAVTVVPALVAAVLTVTALSALYGTPSGAGPRAAAGLLMAGRSGDSWTATLPGEGQSAPKEYVSDVRGCGSLFRWANRVRAVPRGTVEVGYSVGAAPGSATVVRGIRLVKGEAVAPPRGDDVGCVGTGVDEEKSYLRSGTGGGPLTAPALSLDGARTQQKGNFPVRAGGAISGVVSVSTRTCSCTWWLEIDVEENGRPVTVRADDGGRPFRIAPPVRSLSTPAERQLVRGGTARPLSRAAGDSAASPAGTAEGTAAGVSVGVSLEGPSEGWTVGMDRGMDVLSTINGNLDVGGVACRQMYESLIDRGGVLAGSSRLNLQISAPAGADQATLDARVHIKRVEEVARERHQYSCAPPGVDVDGDEARQGPDADRSLYPDTLHALGPFASGSLKYDPDWDVSMSEGGWLPLASEETVYLNPEVGGGNGGMIGADIHSEQATFFVTVEATVTLPSGEKHHFELSDHGRPFVLGPGPAKLPTLKREDFHETRWGPTASLSALG